MPAPWKSAKIWQYSWTGRVPGIAQDVDMDRFMGNRADLLAWVKSTSSHAAPMPTPAPDAGAAPKLDGAAVPAADARLADARGGAGGTGGTPGTGGAGGAGGAPVDPGDGNGPSAAPHGADGGADDEAAQARDMHGCSYGRGGTPGGPWVLGLAVVALVRRRRAR